LPLLNDIYDLDQKYRQYLSELETLNASRNTLSNDVISAKKNSDTTKIATIQKKVSLIKNQINEIQSKINDILPNLKEKILSIPNIPHDSVPVGKDETQNKEMHR
jgi:seryl-tRNA synthetase